MLTLHEIYKKNVFTLYLPTAPSAEISVAPPLVRLPVYRLF